MPRPTSVDVYELTQLCPHGLVINFTVTINPAQKRWLRDMPKPLCKTCLALWPLVPLLVIVASGIGCRENRGTQDSTSQRQGIGTPEINTLAERIEYSLQLATDLTRLSTRRNTPWELAHAALGLGIEGNILDESTGQEVSLREYFQREVRINRNRSMSQMVTVSVC